MIPAVLGLHHHVIYVALHRMVDQVAEDVCHGPLVRRTSILQAEWHDGVVEVALRGPKRGVDGVVRIHLDLVVA